MRNEFLFLFLISVIFACQPKSSKNLTKGTVVTESIEDVLEPTQKEELIDSISEKQLRTTGRQCVYQALTSTLGIGLVIPKEEFTIYNDDSLNEVYWSENIYNVSVENQKCCPRYHKPDYGIMHFICQRKVKNSFEILVNASEKKYMANDLKVVFKTWEEYIKDAMGIRTSDGNPLRMGPSEKSSEILLSKNYESMCGLEIEGEWLKVQMDCKTLCNESALSCEDSIIGWIKWRNSERLLIEIALLS